MCLARISSNVLRSDTIRHNCISISQTSDIGTNVTYTPSGVAVANGVTSITVCHPHCGRR